MKRRRWLCGCCDQTVGTFTEGGALVVSGDRRLAVPALAVGTVIVILTCGSCGAHCRWPERPANFETKTAGG